VSSDLARVVIADDHAPSLLVFIDLLEPEFKVVGTARNGKEALAAVAELHPDVVVLDIEMPIMDGLSAARTLVALDPAPRIVMLTTFADADYVDAALKLGAAGYVLKLRAPLDLCHAVRLALGGQKFISPGAIP
jgi:DNA-binding NarL/FixJ family response regulator